MSNITDGQTSPKQFYRRKLPDKCISFCSDMGKQLFAEALATGHMDCYFKLASQFRTQDEPAYCGLTTLVVVLNALDVDPGKVWKDPWRWYHEDMLNCCVPLDLIQKKGINIDEFVCIGTCNSLNVEVTRIDEHVTEEMFREVVKEYSKRDDAFLALSYSRPVLGQTGEGHFSPLGGYHPEKDLLLILDLARFKYPPHWVSLTLIFEAMKAIDKDTGFPRGFMKMSRSGRNMLVLFRLSEHMSIRSRQHQLESVSGFIKGWNSWLRMHHSTRSLISEVRKDGGGVTATLLHETVHEFVQSLLRLNSGISLLTLQQEIKCPTDIAEQQKCFIGRLVHELESTTVFAEMVNVIENLEADKKEKLSTIFPLLERSVTCSVYARLRVQHLASILLMSWPDVCEGDACPVCFTGCSNNKTNENPPETTLESEICALREQLLVVFKFREKYVCKSKACVMPR